MVKNRNEINKPIINTNLHYHLSQSIEFAGYQIMSKLIDHTVAFYCESWIIFMIYPSLIEIDIFLV